MYVRYVVVRTLGKNTRTYVLYAIFTVIVWFRILLMGRDRGKGKARGGPRLYISNVEEMALRDARESEYNSARNARRALKKGEGGEDDESDEGSDDDSDEEEEEKGGDGKVHWISGKDSIVIYSLYI